MSLFTRHRKITRINKVEQSKRLAEGFNKIGESMNKMIETMKLIESEHPEYESLSQEQKIILLKEYYGKYNNAETLPINKNN